MRIAQLSDVHVGGGRYREELLRAAIEEINTAAPDLVVVAGDLTDEGYPDQYPLAKEELSALACPLIVRVPGNHDARNVGYLHFEDTFGARDSRLRLELDRLKIALVAVDSSKPDLDEGEIGREHYGWIEEGFAGEADLRVFVSTTWCQSRAPAASETRCLTRATSSRYSASARSTSSSPATATSLTSGRSRACCSSTPAPSPRCARAASPTPPTTSSASRRGGSPSTSAFPAASSRAWVTTRATGRPNSPPATPTHSCAPNAESRWRRMRRQHPGRDAG